MNGKNNISPVNSNIESIPSSNDSEHLKKLNHRLDQFMNNNYNYSKNEPSPLNSNNSGENDVDMFYIRNIINKSDNDYNDIEDGEYVNLKNENDLKNNLTNKQDLQNVIKLLGKKRQKKDSDCIKSFINNKFNDVLSKSNLSDKLLLYSLINNGTIIKEDDSNSDDGVNNFNKAFDQETIEKYFQKEVIRFTIENFCKYLKENGYSIIKQDNERNDSDQKSKKKELKCPHTDKKHYAKVDMLYLEYV